MNENTITISVTADHIEKGRNHPWNVNCPLGQALTELGEKPTHGNFYFTSDLKHIRAKVKGRTFFFPAEPILSFCQKGNWEPFTIVGTAKI